MEVEGRGQLFVRGAFEGGVRREHRVVLRADTQARGRDRRFIRGRDDKQVVQVDGLERRADLVQSIFVASDDLEVEVELGARRQRDGQSLIGFKPARYLTARSL